MLRDAGMWAASCLCYARAWAAVLMMLVFGWLLVPADAHDARLWRFSCGLFVPVDADDACHLLASFPADTASCLS